MEKIKQWLKPRNNKIIAGIGIVAIVSVSIIALVLLNQKPKEPTLVFRENIILEYGHTTEAVDNSELTNPVITIVDPLSLIKVTESKYDEISLNKILKDGEVATLEFAFIDTMKLGKQKGEIYARLDTVIREFEFEFEIKDTQMPVLEGVKDIETEYGMTPNITDLFKASDPVDGVLEIVIIGDINYNTAGVYKMIAEAKDKNNNKTEQAFTITVKEEVEVVVTEPTPTPSGSNGNSNTAQSGNTTGSSAGNSSSNNSSNSGNVGLVEPTPTPPIEEEWENDLGDLIFYKDYGTYEGCAAVIEDVLGENRRVWISNFCDDKGTMYYVPR